MLCLLTCCLGISAVNAAGLPAARVTDRVGSPDGINGQILPPGEATVLIEGLPAARLGDQVQCTQLEGETPVLTVESIVQGSATVLIGGLPAARVGDTSASGCTLVSGSSTVLIGN
ncbi:PAAR domain-containing protein [Marinobacterium sp. YM272]|uniref:PAAR domain-containing protein n=1 Tax=Marinobacterium sp. YM272 TaxID=3421654 RepID=UPI003D7F6EDA